MLMNIFGILVAVLILSVLIAVHEAGHLLMAKWSNIRVDTFSVGMGKAIWGFQYGETYYQIGRLPFGGFCAFGDEENPNDQDPRALINSPLWARLLTVIGGSLFNIIFAFLMMTLLFGIGFTQKQLTNQVYVPETILNSSSESVVSPAYKAGLRSGDYIIAVSEQSISYFTEIPITLAYTRGTQKNITYTRDGQTNSVLVDVIVDSDSGMEIIGVFPVQPAIIGDVSVNSPAEKAGIQIGDKIGSINDMPIQFFFEIQEIVKQQNPLNMVIQRGEETLEISVSSMLTNGGWLIGIQGGYPQEISVNKKSDSIMDAFIDGANYIEKVISQIVQSIGKLFSGQTDVRKNLSGPVRIVAMTGVIAKTLNMPLIVEFMVMLSLALAVFNMMPLPGLDGGAIILQSARSIFKNNTIAEKIIGWIEYGGILLLLVLAAFVFINDIRDISGYIQTADKQSEEK